MLGFETIQILLHGGVVNAQELVGGGHHVDAVGLALGTFPVHELIHRLIVRRTPENRAHHQEQGSAQSRGAALEDAAAADCYLAGLISWLKL